jgi:hypothetical protein
MRNRARSLAPNSTPGTTRASGLTRGELRYILDLADVTGPD